jgi:hypothetical protein
MPPLSFVYYKVTVDSANNVDIANTSLLEVSYMKVSPPQICSSPSMVITIRTLVQAKLSRTLKRPSPYLQTAFMILMECILSS